MVLLLALATAFVFQNIRLISLPCLPCYVTCIADETIQTTVKGGYKSNVPVLSI